MKTVELYGVNLAIKELTSECDDSEIKKGDDVYVLWAKGNINLLPYNALLYGDLLLQGNISKDKAYLEAKAKQRAAETKVLNRMRELEREYGADKVDWGNVSQRKRRFLYYSNGSGIVESTSYGYIQDRPTEFYTTSKKVIEQTLKEMPEDIKTMLTGGENV